MNDSNVGSFASLARAPTRGPSSERRIPSTGTRLLLLLSLAACGFPRPPDLPGDAAVDTPDPSFVLQVSPSGDDANDGLLQPVKTLKHAIGLAAADARITKIVLASGTYSGSSGETFPYAVASNVVITGPAGGGAILVGDKTAPGISLNRGGLQNLEFQSFSVAITVTGQARLENIRVSTDAIAIQIEAMGSLTAENVDVTGTSEVCATGVALNGDAILTISGLTTRALGTSVLAMSSSSATITHTTLLGRLACQQAMLSMVSSGSLVVSDSLVDGGYLGIDVNSRTNVPAQALCRETDYADLVHRLDGDTGWLCGIIDRVLRHRSLLPAVCRRGGRYVRSQVSEG